MANKYWLVERGSDPRRYLQVAEGGGDGLGNLYGTGRHSWCTSPQSATRFRTKADAESEAKIADETCAAFEHIDCSGPERSPDADIQVIEAMHILGAKEGETLLELAHRLAPHVVSAGRSIHDAVRIEAETYRIGYVDGALRRPPQKPLSEAEQAMLQTSPDITQLRGAYEPLTAARIEELRGLWLSQDTPDVTKEEWKKLCDMAANSLPPARQPEAK